MVKSVFAEELLLNYVHNLSKNNPFSIGLVLGQPTPAKDYVIHFAKTPPTEETPVIKDINNVSEEWVADHARQISRMLPGGMCVLGLFVVANEDLLTTCVGKIRLVLVRIHKLLESNKYLCGNNDELFCLNYCKTSQQFSCKNFDVKTGLGKVIDFKFSPKATKWHQIECKFQLDEIYQISATETDWPLKKHMGLILDQIDSDLKKSMFLFDGEIRNGDDYLDNVGKKKKIAKNYQTNEELEKIIQVTILQQCSFNDKQTFQVTQSSNQIKILGQVVSKIFLHSKSSIEDCCESIIQDIMRSLSTRFEMHWDSLTEEEHGEDINSVHEPPRRVLLTLPNSKIKISDYLFPGEGAHDAQMSIEETLDIKILHKRNIEDLEGQADLSDYFNENLAETDSNEEIVNKLPPMMKNKSNFLIFGLAIGVFVLIISIVIHFMYI